MLARVVALALLVLGVFGQLEPVASPHLHDVWLWLVSRVLSRCDFACVANVLLSARLTPL